MGKNGKKGLARIVSALKNGIDGVYDTFKTEAAFRQEVAAFIIMFIAAIMLNVTAVERAILIITLFIVLIAEVINTSVEAISDKISPEYDDFIKKAKDAGAAAVLLSIINALIVWAIIVANII